MEKSQKMSFWQVVKRFFEPVTENPKLYVINVIRSSFQGLIIAILPLILEGISNALSNGDKYYFYFYLFIFFLQFSLIFIVEILSRKSMLKCYVFGENFFYKKYMNEFFNAENTFIEKMGTGKFISIINSGLTSMAYISIASLTDITRLFIILLSSFFIIAKTSFLFLLFTISIIVIVFFRINKFNSFTKKYRKQVKDIQLEVDRGIVRQIMSKFEIVQQNKIDSEFKARFKWNDKRLDLKIKEKMRNAFCFDGANWFVNLITFILVFGVGYGILIGFYTMADYILVSSLGLILFAQISKITTLGKDFYDKFVNIEKLIDVFSNMPKSEFNSKGLSFTYKSGNIKIHNMSFGYDKSQVFQNFSLQIQGSTKTAFVGESGGGKTTLIKLLAGYIRPDRGEIEIDGQKLSKIKLTDYYKHIGYLTQDPSVFDGTIYENLVYALDAEPPKEDLKKVVKLAKCEFIREFEKGLETEIGERGVRLSGGQKQRLAIAKIMLKNPNIILLDEPTSALDSFNEEQISIALHNLFKGKTVIVVAHRLQTVKQADRILLFEQGKILEEGTHDELVKVGGKYKKMLDLQSGF